LTIGSGSGASFLSSLGFALSLDFSAMGGLSGSSCCATAGQTNKHTRMKSKQTPRMITSCREASEFKRMTPESQQPATTRQTGRFAGVSQPLRPNGLGSAVYRESEDANEGTIVSGMGAGFWGDCNRSATVLARSFKERPASEFFLRTTGTPESIDGPTIIPSLGTFQSTRASVAASASVSLKGKSWL